MMKHRAYTSVFRAHFSALALSFVALTTWAQQPTLTWLGVPQGTYDSSAAWDISADGKVVVVTAKVQSDFGTRGFLWTRDRGFILVNNPGGVYSVSYAISQDGLTMVGRRWRIGGAPFDATQWTLAGGPLDFGVPAGNGPVPTAYDVSYDGSVIVGVRTSDFQAFIWRRDSGLTYPGTLGGNQSRALGVSADGSIVVGYAQDSSGKYRAFRWTQQTGMQNLGASVLIGTISFPYDHSEAFGISPDGNVIVGIAYNDRNEAVGFRNILQGTLRVNISLGDPPAGFTGVYPRRANQDGSIIVGSMRKSDGTLRAMRWTQAGGLEDLNVTYASLLGQGEYLVEAFDITPDGRYIVGNGFKDGKFQGYILDTGVCNLPADVNRDGTVDDADLLDVLFNFGSSCGN
jgi:probable HAF family extracellular repeat protein